MFNRSGSLGLSLEGTRFIIFLFSISFPQPKLSFLSCLLLRLDTHHFPLVFVGLMHGLGIRLLNSLPNLGMKIFDLLGSFLGLPTKLARCGNGSEVQGGLGIVPIDHLERREVGGFA